MHRQIAGKLTGPITKWVVVGFWLVLLIVIGPFAGKLTGVLNNDSSSWLPDDTESTLAMQKLASFQDPNAMPTVVVYEAKSGVLTKDQLDQIAAQSKKIQALDGVVGEVIGPITSKDGQVAQTLVVFDLGSDAFNKMPDRAEELEQIAQVVGVKSYIAGQGGQAADSAEAFAGLDGTLLMWTAIAVIVILLLTYRSPALWMLPIISSFVALGIAQGVVYFLAKDGGMTVNGQSQGMLTVLVFGAGTDYALLLVARYREELRRHEDRHEAMAFALHRAAPAIFASGSTVILGMLCLLLASVNATSGLGPVAAIGIAIALAVMLTLLPALLVITGRWIFWPARPKFASQEPTTSGLWARLGKAITKSPRAVWAVTALILLACSLGLLKLNATGLSTEDTYTKKFDSVVGQQILTDHHLADRSNQLMIVTNADHADQITKAVKGVGGVGPASPPVVKDGVALVSVPMVSETTAAASFDTVRAVREAVHAVDGAEALVGGASATFYDYQKAATRDNKVVIPAVLLVVMLVLMVLLRALFSPVLLILTVVLSFAASLGLSALIFHYIFGFKGTDASLPLYIFVFLVALGIDYNIFLMTRVREETPAHGTRKASLVALAATGGVITSAGAVLAATFLVLATMPLVSFVEIGIAVALGVILDTMVVRSVLVTALNLDLGPKIWWPSKLDRQPDHQAAVEEISG